MCAQSNMNNTTRTHHPPMDCCGRDPVLCQCSVSPFSIFLMVRCIALFMFWFDRHSKDNSIHVAHNTPLQPFLCIPKIVPAIHVLIPWCLMNTLYYAHTVYLITLKPSTSRGESPQSGKTIRSALKY